MSYNRFFPVLSTLALVLSMLACNIGSSAPAAPSSSSGGSPGSSGSGACNNPLYPVVVGASWSYTLTGPISSSFTRTVTGLTADGFNDQDVFANGVSRTGNWNCNNGALIALNPNSSGGGDSSVQSSHATANFHTTAMEGVTLPATVNVGDSWSQNFTLEGAVTLNGQDIPAKDVVAFSCTAGATESVTVPAGTFNAVHMDCTSDITITITMNGVETPSDVNTSSTMWYAAGVGMVKSSNLINGANANTLELTAYNIP